MARRALVSPAAVVHRPVPSIIRASLTLGALLCALIAAMVAGTLVGSVRIPPGETLQILLYKLGLSHGHVTWTAGDEAIIWLVRFPRVIAAALVGAALSVAGTLFQAVLRNPLADPYVIGTSAGAQLGVSVAFLFPLNIAVFGFGATQVCAFGGALATVLFVYALARTGGRTPVVTLLLAGFVTSSFLISGTSLLMVAGNRVSEVVRWTMGSIAASSWDQVGLTGLFIVLAAAGSYVLAASLDVLLLGEEHAVHLGVRVESLKLVAIVLAALLTALAVTLAGVVAFVGLVVPHTMRLIYGPGHRLLIPAAALGGAAFLILADLVARITLTNAEIPLSAVTAVIGAPFFLHLLRRTRKEYAL